MVLTLMVTMKGCIFIHGHYENQMWRLARWDSAEIFIINFRSHAVQAELNSLDEQRVVEIERSSLPYHDPYTLERFERWVSQEDEEELVFLNVWKEGQFADISQDYRNPYDTSELEPVGIYQHAEGSESLKLIKVFEGETLLHEISFSRRDPEGKGYTLFTQGGTVYPYSLKNTKPAVIPENEIGRSFIYGNTGREFIYNLPIISKDGIFVIIEWEHAPERREAEYSFEINPPWIDRYDDLVNPRIFIIIAPEGDLGE